MRFHLTRLAIGVGSGAAAATLFLAATRGTSLGVALAYLGPLPIMIATLGWSFDAGLAALFVACALVAAVAPGYAVVYGLLIAGPAWGLAAFAAAPALWAKRPENPAAPRLYPGPGAIALLAAALFIVAGAVQLALMWAAKGGYASAVTALSNEIRAALDSSGATRELPADLNPDDLAVAMVQIAPTALATGALVMHLANLYLAARSVQLSQRLSRPWRDIPSGFVLPRWLAAPGAVGLAAALFAPDPFDDYGLVVTGALGALYAMQGLAALHALSRQAAARPFMLAALYFACAVAAQWVAPALALLGLAESFADLRGRAARSLKPRT
ncbi:MAG: DUF2232 domain-containing protein [Pseudomonadota bacterium]|nr:DUF2232 domain-containing protein [Pseudomonadota bacterium]